MARQLVIVDINRVNDEALKAHMSSFNGTGGMLFENVWVFSTRNTIIETKEFMMSVLSENERLLVADFSGDSAWNNLKTEDAVFKFFLESSQGSR